MYVINKTAACFVSLVIECEKSSPTSYFWYRNALDITDSIDETGSFNPYMVCCLLAAWTIVCLGMFKGIKTSVKVTALFACTHGSGDIFGFVTVYPVTIF